MTSLEFHALAEVFPPIQGEDFNELVADVRAHGVREPIWLFEGQILEGRHRYLAAQAAGVDCPIRPYEGNDPLGFVISMNLKRRHLTTSQRAMVAAKLANMRQGERTDLPSIEGRFVSQEQAAKLLNVGVASVERAKIVQSSGEPELIAAIDSGELSVSGAVERIRRGIRADTKGRQQPAKKKRRPKHTEVAPTVKPVQLLPADTEGRLGGGSR